MAEPHRSRTPAPRQPSPAGSGPAWFTPVQQPPRLPPAAAWLQHGLTPAAAVACSPSTTPAASPRYAPAPRTCSPMWPKLVTGAKDGGADCIETYVFWNGQETAPGKCYFKERFDLVQFARVVKDAGLYRMLRIGLFVPAEWNFGGVPVWLHCIPTTVFRTDNEPFKSHMNEGAAAGDDYGHFPLKLASNLYLGSVWHRIEWTVIMYSISLKTRIGSNLEEWLLYVNVLPRCCKCITMLQP